ncbi:MAG: 2-deoxy-D-gluconate 3-dehydrogenase [Acidobacteria bacterium]|nr:MAG: 2-deoxy-D-gluconate 3-dehydrogenase [Acidobacteriota bacterium]
MTVLDRFDLEGRRALVTGGARGLGRTMAQALAEAGSEVAIASRTLEACRVAADEISRATGRRTAAFAVDLNQFEGMPRFVREVESDFGAVDILVNNAGINVRGASEEIGEADWDAVVDTNLKAPFLLARALGPGMCTRGWGRVINLGSILSVVALPGRAPYASSKAGLLGLTRVLALEWAGRGVTVNAICPGPFATDMNQQLLSDPVRYKGIIDKIPMGRWGELDDIAGAAVFLASEASSFVTGTALFVDGGWTAA